MAATGLRARARFEALASRMTNTSHVSEAPACPKALNPKP